MEIPNGYSKSLPPTECLGETVGYISIENRLFSRINWTNLQLYRHQWSVCVDARDPNVADMARLGFIGWILRIRMHSIGSILLGFPTYLAEKVFATTFVAFLTFFWASFPVLWDGVAAFPACFARSPLVGR